MKQVALLTVVLVLAAGCRKEERVRQKMSGLYTVNAVERVWYGADSAASRTDLGSIGLYDNATNTFNNLVHNLAEWPLSWNNNGVGGDQHQLPIGWYADDVDGTTLTIFSEVDRFFQYAVYTVEHEGGNDYTWTYVENDANSNLTYKEVWRVTRE